MNKDVFSLFIDGSEIKLVWTKRVKDQINILSVENIPLKSRIEEKEKESIYQMEEIDADPFGVEYGKEEGIEEKSDDNKSVFYEILNKYSVEKGVITINLPESNVGFFIPRKISENSKRKIKRSVREEINKNYSISVMDEEFDLVSGDNGELVAVFQRGGNPVIDVLEEIRPFLGKKIKIELAEVNEIALVNLVNRVYTFKEEEISVIIYIGIDFSRIIFMKENKILNISPIVNEGYNSENILSRLYGKISLERDESSIAEFGKILLAGEAVYIKSKEFFEEKFPDAVVEYVRFDDLNLSGLEKSEIDNLSLYAIPLSSAWKVLEPKNKQFIQTNFIPKIIKERQKSFKLAGHGLIFLIALCAASIYFLGHYLIMERQIKRAEYVTTLLEEQIVSGEQLLAELESIQKQINVYENNFKLYNSLTKDYDLISNFLNNLSKNIKTANSIWLDNLNITDYEYSMSGESVYRTRISKFVSFYDNYTINNVNGIKVRNIDVFKFNIKGNVK